MDLINDLSSDVAFAVIAEQRFRQRLDTQAARSLIDRIESELAKVADIRRSFRFFEPTDEAAVSVSR